MSTPNLNGGAVARVSLTEVPIKLRRFYGRLLLDRAIKEMDSMAALEFAGELHRAVEDPSDKVYWVRAEAVSRVLG